MRYLSLTGEPLDIMGLTAAQFLCGAVLLIPYLFLSGDVGASDWGSAELWWSIAFIVIGAQVIAYLTFYIALTPLAELARLPVDVPLARGRDPDRGDPRQPPGRPCPRSAWRSSWRGWSSSTCPPRRRPPCRRSRRAAR